MGGKVVIGVWLAFAAVAAARADCRLVQIAEFHTAPGTRSPVVEGTINGKPVKVLIDTSSETFIPIHEARELGLTLTVRRGVYWSGTTGRTQAYEAYIRFQVGDMVKPDLPMPVIGDPHTASPYSVVLGEDFFDQVDTEFDLAHDAIRLFRPEGCTPPQLVYWGAAYSQAGFATVDPDTPQIEAQAQLNGKMVWATLDTGDPSSIVDTVTAQADGVQWPPPDAIEGPRLHGVGPRRVESRVGLFSSFALGDERVSNLRLLVASIGRNDWYHPRMYIGADFFRTHRVYIDMKDRLILFSYAGGQIFCPDAPP